MTTNLYKGTTFEAEFSYPSGLDRTFQYEFIAASEIALIPNTAFTVTAEDSLKVTAPASITSKWKAATYTLTAKATATTFEGTEAPVSVVAPVSYTHLTLPTICSV